MNYKNLTALAGVLGLAAFGTRAAETTNAPAASPAPAAQPLFPDEILCQGKGVEIRRSQLDQSFLQFKANLTARGQTVPDSERETMETRLLDRLIVTKLLAQRATDEDRQKAREAAAKFTADTKEKAGSPESFQRQLQALNFTAEQFDAQVLERAVCEEVVNREIKSKVNLTDDQLRKYYDDHGEAFDSPEMVHVAHILLSTRDPVTGQEISDAQKQEKMDQMKKLLERARQGEDFATLAKAYSEDSGSRDNGGEYTFARGRMAREFEAAAFNLKTNEVSDIVTTQFGYHIIKLYEKLPARKVPLDEAKDRLKDFLERQEVQKQLPAFLERLKTEANLQYLHGAKPVVETAEADAVAEDAPAKPAPQPADK
jgi:peptidyl-prolyl cis-trans isomerase C